MNTDQTFRDFRDFRRQNPSLPDSPKSPEFAARSILYLLSSILFAVALVFPQNISAAGPHSSLPRMGSLDGLGVNIHFTDPQPGEMEMIAAAGFKWIRNDLAWAATEREKGRYDFAAYDRLLAALEKQKMHALFILDYGNKVYAEADPPRTEEARAAFARWAVAVVAHFKGKGCLFEMWNEPNGTFWKPKANVDEYIALAKATGQALREAGLAGGPNLPEAYIGPATSTIDMGFLEACFKAGLLDYWDAVSVHPYRQSAPETVEEEYRAVRALIAKYAPKDKTIPIISGEWGYSTAWKDFDDDLQGKYLPRQFLTNIANDVPLSIWYDWHDDGTDPKEAEHHFGIVHHQYRAGQEQVFEPKPAYLAAKALMTQLDGMQFSKRLVGPGDGDCLLFSNQEKKIVVARALPRSPDSRPAGEFSVAFPSEGDFKVVDVAGRSLSPVVMRRYNGGDWVGAQISMPLGEIRYLTPDGPNWFLDVAAASSRLPLEIRFHWPYERDGNSANAHMKEDFAISNPLSETISFQDYRQIDGFSIPLAPGKTQILPAGNVSRTISEKVASGAVVFFKKAQAPLVQETTMLCENPLELELLPPGRDALFVRVLNPSGEAANLVVRQDNASAPVKFAAGETETSAKLPLVADAKWPRRIALQVATESDGSTVLEHDFGLIQPLPSLDAHAMKAEPDGDKNSAAEFSLSESDESPANGVGNSVKLHYSFSSGWKFVSLKPKDTSIPQSNEHGATEKGQPQKFGLWIKSDGQGCMIRLRFTDATGQVFQPDGAALHWKGWRYVTFSLTSSHLRMTAHWGGANDGEVHYPIKWDSILLLDNTSRQPLQGDIYLSAPMLSY
jgi:polysaccharide biosynthesis protein PslG